MNLLQHGVDHSVIAMWLICFVRMKTRWRGQQPPQIRFGKEVEDILATLPKTGSLFPYL